MISSVIAFYRCGRPTGAWPGALGLILLVVTTVLYLDLRPALAAPAAAGGLSACCVRPRSIFGVAVMAFLLLPLVAILPLAFTVSIFLNYPIPSASLRWFEELATADAWRLLDRQQPDHRHRRDAALGRPRHAAALGLQAAAACRSPASCARVFLLPMVVPAVVLGVGLQIALVRLGLASSYHGVILAHTRALRALRHRQRVDRARRASTGASSRRRPASARRPPRCFAA